jgi:chromosome segregation ATPase
LKSLLKATKDQLTSRTQELDRSQALIAELSEKEKRRRAASKEAAAKSKEQLAAAAEVELAAQGRINELESKLSSAKATAAGLSKEVDAFKARLAESLSAQKDLKEQLLHTSSELERTHSNLAEITEKESLGRSQAWDALNKLKEKLLTSVQNENLMKSRMIELESSASATSGSLLASGKQIEVLHSKIADLESSCKTLRSQLESSKSEQQQMQISLSDLTEKEKNSRQKAKDTIEQLNEKLESTTFAKTAAHSTATKEADVLKARVADLESCSRTLREQLSSSQSELDRTQASLADMTDKELKGRQSAKDVTEKLREKLSLAAEAELGMKARISELEDALKAKSMSLTAAHKDVDSLKSRLADAEAAHKSMSDQYLQCSVDLERSQAASRACGKRLSSTAFDLESARSSLSDMTERAHSLQDSLEKLKMKLTATQNAEASAQHRVAELEQALAGKANALLLATKECETLRNVLAEAESTGRMLKAKCESLESDKQKLNAALVVGAEKEALMAARGRESTEQLQEMLKSAAKVLDEVRQQLSLSEASASDYAHKCEVLTASLRDSQAHCRDLEKQISSSLLQVSQSHDAIRRLQDEVGSRDAELSNQFSQSRDLRSQIESLVSEYKQQTEVIC